MGKKQLLMYILIFYLAKVFLCRSEEYFLYILLYLVGRLIRKVDLIDKLKLNVTMGYWTMTTLIFMVSYSLYLFTDIKTSVQQSNFILAFNYANPFIILQAVALFLVFSRMEFQSKLVNWLSASCLSIFLIHMHPAIKHIGYYAYSESLYALPVLQHIGMLIVLIVGVFFGSILIDKIRIQISNFVYRVIQWLVKSIKGKISFSCLVMRSKLWLYNE